MVKGWFRESYRHSLAAKGIKTGRKSNSTTKALPPPDYYANQYSIGILTANDAREMFLNEKELFPYGIHSFMMAHGIFQLWNKEQIDDIASYIKKERLEPVVEVAAGDGLLSMMLKKQGIDIIATDIKGKARKKYHVVEKASVKEMDALEAIRKYKPKTVIVSWIPYGSDLDRKLLRSEVENVIIIGEPPSGATGSFDDEKLERFVRSVGRKIMDTPGIDRHNYARTDYAYEGKIKPHSFTSHFKKVGK